MKGTVHQLKVTLRGVDPPVWRRIVVASDMTLGEMAPLLEAAMGWLGGHLHSFETEDARYGMANPAFEMDDLDEGQFELAEVLPEAGASMRWDYDFGDGWEHDVVVEAVGAPEPGVEPPVCLDGKRACPPDDCGGPWGYAELVDILADPDHPDPDDLREWVPPGFDPARFDRDEATEEMRSPRPWAGGDIWGDWDEPD